MAKLDGIKVVLSTGKTVLLRKMKIRDHETAAEIAGNKRETTAGQSSAMSQELLRLLLIQINDHKLTGVEREDLDALFEMEEYIQLQSVLSKLLGGGKVADAPKFELVSIGAPSLGSVDTQV